MIPTRPASSRRRRPAALSLAALLLLALSACHSSDGTRPKGDVYSVRGEIVRLPAAGSPEIWIHHEAVPDLRDDNGKVTGMESMTMPFELARDANLTGLKVGDPVRFELRVNWQAAHSPVVVGAFQKLPSGTKLDFGPSSQEGSAAPR